MMTHGEIDLIHMDMRELSARLSNARTAWQRGEHVELDGSEMVRAIEAAIGLLLRNDMPAVLGGLASRVGVADQRIARFREGDTSYSHHQQQLLVAHE